MPQPRSFFLSLVPVITPFLCQGKGISFWLWVTAAVLKLSSGTLALAMSTLILLPACLVRECCSRSRVLSRSRRLSSRSRRLSSSCFFVRSCRPFANWQTCWFLLQNTWPIFRSCKPFARLLWVKGGGRSTWFQKGLELRVTTSIIDVRAAEDVLEGFGI